MKTLFVQEDSAIAHLKLMTVVQQKFGPQHHTTKRAKV
jgi:hypothetical protein